MSGDKPMDQHGNPFTSYFVTASAITVSATTSAGNHTALYVGGAGDLDVQFQTGGSSVTFTVPAGAILPIQVAYINSTATTATNIIGLL